MTAVYDQIINYAASFTRKKYWKWKLVAILVICMHLLSPPGYRYLNLERTGWKDLDKKIENLFAQTASDQFSNGHSAAIVYRLTVPVIAKVFHLNPVALLVINFFIGMGILYLITALTARTTGDEVTGLFIGIAAATIHVGKSAFCDFYPFFDEWAFLFLLLAMFCRSPLLVFTFCFLAAWTDERALLCLFFVYFWWKFTTNGVGSLKFSSFFKFDKYSVAVIGTVVSYTVIRLSIRYYFGLVPHLFDMPEQIMFNLACQRLAAWSYFEGLWLLILFSVVLYFKTYKWNLFFIVLLAGSIGYLLFSFTIGDLTRSGTYMFPVVFIAIVILTTLGSIAELRLLAFFSALVCVIFPPLVVSCDAIQNWILGQWLFGDLVKIFYYDFWLQYVR